MKYIKTFENKILDRILDKYSKYGKKSLSRIELEYLDKYNSSNKDELEKELLRKKNRISSLFEYDPREDSEFFSELSDESGIEFNFDQYSDDEINAGRYSILYDELGEDEIITFLDYYDIPLNRENLPGWDLLSKDIQEKFKEYIDNIY